ncbi:MAG: hypothetical protein V4665_03050 [Patescibacteria group bacterium]
MQKTLYDLPYVLFEEYLKEKGITDIKTGTLSYNHYLGITVTFAHLPKGKEGKRPAVMLIDYRPRRNEVVVFLLLSCPEKLPDNTQVDYLPAFGMIRTICYPLHRIEEGNHEGHEGIVYHLETRVENLIQSVPLSWDNMLIHYFADLKKKAQELHSSSSRYEWITSYQWYDSASVPLAINGKPVTTLVEA